MSDIDRALDAVGAMLEAVHAELAAGRSVELAPLERLVERACGAVAEAPRERYAELRPRVEAVLAELDRVERMLRRRFEKDDPRGS